MTEAIADSWPTRHLFGVPVHALSMNEVLGIVDEVIRGRGRLLLGVVNAAKLVNMHRDPVLGQAVLTADMILADGMAVVWACRLLGRPLPERVPGIDLMERLLECGSERHYRVYLLGAKQDVLEKTLECMRSRYPGVEFVGHHDGYFSSEEEPRLVEEIRASRPDLLFVAMTSPKKEQFLAQWADQMAVPVCHGVGGAFDVMAGKVRRAPVIWQRLGLEWLFRVVQEPRRMWKRYLVTNTLFCGMVFSDFMGRYRRPRQRDSSSNVDVMPEPPLRVLLLISNLEYGGAQRQVIELTNGLNQNGIETHVCCLSNYVPLADTLHNAAQHLHIIEKKSKFDLTVVPRLADLVKRLKIEVIHTFLFDAEIAGRLAGRLVGEVSVIGSERNTNYKRKWRHTVALRLTGCCFDAIIANSHSGKHFQMRSLGIADDRIFVVHNGVDVGKFKPKQKGSLRSELGIADNAPVVGMVASFKRQKNHLMFFRMAKHVLEKCPETRFLCVGAELHQGLQDSDSYFEEMKTAIHEMGLSQAVLLLGNRDDLVDIYNLCDLTVLTSHREGTPNVLLESMACGVPVVATDVSDNAIVVADSRAGYIVPDDDHEAMAARVTQLLCDETLRQQFKLECRNWVEENFSISALVQKTSLVYGTLFERKRHWKNGHVKIAGA